MDGKSFIIKEIARVESGNRGFCIKLNDGREKLLSGLEGFSHVQVYWWAHFLDSQEFRTADTVEKPYKKGPAELGIFATRSPMRPNPVAMTLVPVTWIDGEAGELGIAFIDAEPGTPVLDIKPYYGMERVREYRVPDWCSHWPAWYEEAADFDWAGEFENAR